MPLRNHRLLVTTHSAPHYMPVPAYSTDQIVAGPRWPTRRAPDGRIVSVNTPLSQPYDLSALVDALPAKQRPELVISRVDGSNQNLPVNAEALDVPTVLVIGDTHHMHQPLTKMIDFARAERYDYYLLDHTRQHAHWFVKAGIRNLYWVPGFLLPERMLQPSDRPEFDLSFVGTVGPQHVLRTRLIEDIRAAGVDIHVTTARPDETREIYRRSSVTLNCSLNGDLNLRNFEVPMSGGLAITDRISDYAGMDLLFREGRHYLAYSSVAELKETLDALLADPNRVMRMKRRAHKHVMREHSLAARALRLYELVFAGGSADETWLIRDPRLLAYGVDSRDDFFLKKAFYEYVQELHRVEAAPSVVIAKSGDPRIACDLLDLPRLRLAAVRTQAGDELFGKLPHGEKVRALEPGQEWAEADAIVVLSAAEAEAVDGFEGRALLVSDWTRRPEDTWRACHEVLAGRLGLRPMFPGLYER